MTITPTTKGASNKDRKKHCDKFLSLTFTIYANDAVQASQVNFHLHCMLKYLLNLVTRDIVLCLGALIFIDHIASDSLPVAVKQKKSKLQ